MTLYALEDVDDAYRATRNLLTPIDRTIWVKLAVVVFFLGLPGVSGNSGQFGFGGDSGGGTMQPGQPFQDPGGGFWLVVGGVVLVVLLVVLAFAFVGAVMEFVFVESLRRETVEIREYWTEHWRRGLRLFGFRLVLGLIVVGSVAVLALPFVLAALGPGQGVGGVAVGAFLLLLPLFIVLAIVVGVVDGFTTVFVVPIMLREERNVLSAWRRLWGSIRQHWTQYLAYAVAGLVLSFVGGMAVAIATGVVALVLLIPFGLLAVLGVGLFVVFEPAGIAVVVVTAVLFGLAVLAAAALVQVPVQTYLRYYALLVLGDIEPGLDVVPDQRAAVRETDGDDDDDETGGSGGDEDDDGGDDGDARGGSDSGPPDDDTTVGADEDEHARWRGDDDRAADGGEDDHARWRGDEEHVGRRSSDDGTSDRPDRG
ncbi:DUF7544 domain-containing protein [Haloarchaeobius salinus]|uniref:DUF7544 domain-containing protein n=1 Tax=Haloarchaeobius salinus TaxID=1198298 RepID=UPI00210BC8AF|nr:DUF4013 domain-containing protein [Haloarchaeobius salinus]